MKRLIEPSHRYGQADFDQQYLNWGLHDPQTQTKEAQSLLRLLPHGQKCSVLDLACGTGTHAIHLALQGHRVTAVDLSETFITKAREAAQSPGAQLRFLVGDLCSLPFQSEFDVVTWIENSFFTDAALRAIHRYLALSGRLILDVRNPENPKTQQRSSNWRTWREKDGIFHLERHETDPATNIRHDVWIEINTHTDTIHEKRSETPALTLQNKVDMIHRAGFSKVQLYTLEGALFTSGADPYWLWLVASK